MIISPYKPIDEIKLYYTNHEDIIGWPIEWVEITDEQYFKLQLTLPGCLCKDHHMGYDPLTKNVALLKLYPAKCIAFPEDIVIPKIMKFSTMTRCAIEDNLSDEPSSWRHFYFKRKF